MSVSSPIGSGEPVSLENLVVRKYVLESTETVILIHQFSSLVLNTSGRFRAMKSTKCYEDYKDKEVLRLTVSF